MPIQPINHSQTSNKPAFTGYVDKSVVKLLNKTVDEIGDFAVQEAKLTGKPVNLDQYCNAIKTRENILNTLRSFMEKLHPNTALKYENGGGLFIKNKKLKSKFRFTYDNNDGNIYPNVICVEKPKSTDLFDILKFSERLNKVNPKELDEQAFKNFTNHITQKAKNISFFPKFRLKRLGEKADKITKEFRQPEIWQDKLLVIHREAKELERQQRIKKKEFKKYIKQSKKIMKDLIKNNKNSQ